MEVWPYGDIKRIRKKVSPEYHKVVDLMQRARIEMKALQRSDHPNTNSIVDLSVIQDINAFFEVLKVRDPNSSQLIVNDELVIDAKAFLQMTQKDRGTLIEETKKLETIPELDTIKLSEETLRICQEYCLNFEKQRKVGSKRIETAFPSIPIKELAFGQIHFETLEPNDVDRVIKFFKDPPIKYNENNCEVIRKMADRFNTENVTDFLAVANYTVRRIYKEINLKRPSTNDKPKDVRDKDYFFETVAKKVILNENSLQDDICSGFHKQIEKCQKHYRKHKLRFKTLMAAADHYDKHSHEFFKFNNNEEVTPEKYFDIAREVCSNLDKNPKWMQDCSSVCWQIQRDDGTIAVRYDNPYKGTAVIATLHVKKKRV